MRMWGKSGAGRGNSLSLRDAGFRERNWARVCVRVRVRVSLARGIRTCLTREILIGLNAVLTATGST